MKHILVPTDFSNCAKAASDYAIQLAQLTNAKIEFLHLQATPVDWVKLPLEKEKLYPEVRKQIGSAKGTLHEWVQKAEHAKLSATQSLIFDKGMEEVFNHIKNHKCDIIIMGSHGLKGIKEKLIGSNAQHILRNSTMPVLIIKQAITKPIKNILFVSDFKDVSVAAFHTITHLADSINAHINLLFVNTPNGFKESSETNKNMEELMTHCHRDESCTKNVIDALSIEEGILDFSKRKTVELIAICTHGRSSLQQLFSPSITEKVVNHTKLPVLSIKL